MFLLGISSNETQGFLEGDAEFDGENGPTLGFMSAKGFFFVSVLEGLLFTLDTEVVLLDGSLVAAVVVVVDEVDEENPVAGGGFLKNQNIQLD